MKTSDRAYLFAKAVLEGGVFAHSVRVASIAVLRGWPSYSLAENAKAVAMLHDVLEDSETEEELLRDLFPSDVVDDVVMLTRAPAETIDLSATYAAYIDRIATQGSRIAREVKLADIQDHLAARNAATLRPTLRARYERAESVLVESLKVGA